MLLRNKKGQAAMEFLMTYGWAILIVIIAIAALVYFGVLSPERFISDQCILEAPLSCSQQGDWIIQAQNSDNVILSIVNGAGKNLQQVTIDIYEADGQLCIPSQTNPTTIADGGKAQFAFTCNDISSITPLDTKFKGDLTVLYRVSSGQFVQESSGRIVGEVQRASSQNPGGGQTQCNDNQDNDNDNFIDCQDSGCVNNGQCDSSDNNEFTAPQCNDNQDNDNDGFIDCQDPGCDDPNDPNLCNSNDNSELNQGQSQCGNGIVESGEECDDGNTASGDGCSSNCQNENQPQCSDGLDNDNDGAIDMNDPGCNDPNDTSEKGTIACDNNLDDDSDSRTDYNLNPNIGDPGCTSPSDTSEKGTIACDDGIDNDNDGTTDMNDPGCISPSDTSEKNPAIECDDNLDNDNDGKTDYNINAGISDPECTSPNDDNESG